MPELLAAATGAAPQALPRKPLPRKCLPRKRLCCKRPPAKRRLERGDGFRQLHRSHEEGHPQDPLKIGISTISSYRGARLFEAVGLSEEILNDYFAGAESRFGGIGIGEIEADVLENHGRVFGEGPAAPKAGARDEGRPAAARAIAPEETEARRPSTARQQPWPPALAAALTKAVREGDKAAWRTYAEGMDDAARQPFAFRDLFSLKKGKPLALESVESVADIVSRFSVAAMSCGAISPEAHEALAAGRIRSVLERFGRGRGGQ